MPSRGEVLAFLRGTRPRPPPGPKRPAATLLLVGAALCHLPLVYLLVRAAAPAAATLVVGLLGMGLAWSGGVALEGRRAGTVRVLGAFGVAEAAFVLVPPVADPLGGARWTFGIIALLCAGVWVESRVDRSAAAA